MKRILIVLIILFPHLLRAQKVVVLHITQPPEFGFSISNQDTTITKGESVALGSDLSVYGGSGEYQYNWSPASSLDDPTIAKPMATPTDTTTYQLTVTDLYGCSFSLDYKVNVRSNPVNVGIITSNSTLHARLFPNPNDGKFRVELIGKPCDKIELTVFDSNGKVVKRKTVLNFSGNHTEIMQLRLVAGTYALNVNNGTESVSRKFIIH